MLAVCATGATFVGTHASLTFADKVFERLDMTLQLIWRRGGNDESYLDVLQVAIMLQFYRIFSGRPASLTQAVALHGVIITLARRYQLFDKDGPCTFTISMEQLREAQAFHTLDVLWRRWIFSETATR